MSIRPVATIPMAKDSTELSEIDRVKRVHEALAFNPDRYTLLGDKKDHFGAEALGVEDEMHAHIAKVSRLKTIPPTLPEAEHLATTERAAAGAGILAGRVLLHDVGQAAAQPLERENLALFDIDESDKETSSTVVADAELTPPIHTLACTRTGLMHRKLAHAKFSASTVGSYFIEDRTILVHKEIPYHVLTGEISPTIRFESTAVVSIGGNVFDREMILMNTNLGKSPRLQASYEAFLETLPASKSMTSTEHVLSSLAKYIHETLMPERSNEAYEAFLVEWKKSHLDRADYVITADSSDHTPLIPLDDFIGAKWGVCRHQALVACYFISRLKREKPDMIPEGTLFHVRDTIITPDKTSVGHVWVLYSLPDGRLFNVDPMINGIYLLHDDAQYEDACTKYSKAILNNLYRRYLGKPRVTAK